MRLVSPSQCGKSPVADRLATNQWHGALGVLEMKWKECDFRPPLCTYRLNWARRTSWGWWDENSSPGGLRLSTLPLDHGGSPQYWIYTSERGINILFLWNLKASVGFEHAISEFPIKQLYPLHQARRRQVKRSFITKCYYKSVRLVCELTPWIAGAAYIRVLHFLLACTKSAFKHIEDKMGH